MERILFYEGKWYMFSNFSSFMVHWCGIDWITVEHAYQATKFIDKEIRILIQKARSAHDAKKIARANLQRVRPEWEQIKLNVMESILRAKLEQHAYIRQKLLETKDAVIIEDSPKDNFWGRGSNWEGQNHLGKLWMKLRQELQK